MTGERAWTAPEMTPAVDAPDDAERVVEDRRGALDQGETEEPKPGEVPGIDTHVDGRSRLGTDIESEENEAPDSRDLPPHG